MESVRRSLHFTPVVKPSSNSSSSSSSSSSAQAANTTEDVYALDDPKYATPRALANALISENKCRKQIADLLLENEALKKQNASLQQFIQGAAVRVRLHVEAQPQLDEKASEPAPPRAPSPPLIAPTDEDDAADNDPTLPEEAPVDTAREAELDEREEKLDQREEDLKAKAAQLKVCEEGWKKYILQLKQCYSHERGNYLIDKVAQRQEELRKRRAKRR